MVCLKLPSFEGLATLLNHITSVNSVVFLLQLFKIHALPDHGVLQPLYCIVGLAFHSFPIFTHGTDSTDSSLFLASFSVQAKQRHYYHLFIRSLKTNN